MGCEEAERELTECRERLTKYESEPTTDHRKRQVNREHHAFHHGNDDWLRAELERLRAVLRKVQEFTANFPLAHEDKASPFTQGIIDGLYSEITSLLEKPDA